MHIFSWIIGLLLAAIWVHRLADTALGMPKLVDVSMPEWDRKPSAHVTIVVPARNEAEHIEPALRSLLALDYPNYEIIAVNDRSTDATGEIMARVAGGS